MALTTQTPDRTSARSAPATPWKAIAGWFLLSRVFLVVCAAVSLRYVPHGAFFEAPKSVLDWFIHWDAGWFRDVVENG